MALDLPPPKAPDLKANAMPTTDRKTVQQNAGLLETKATVQALAERVTANETAIPDLATESARVP